MARTSGPLFSLEARGGFGKSLIFQNQRGRQVVKRWAAPANPQTQAQRGVRVLASGLRKAWTLLDPALKSAWTDFYQGQGLSPLESFLRYNMHLGNATSFSAIMSISDDIRHLRGNPVTEEILSADTALPENPVHSGRSFSVDYSGCADPSVGFISCWLRIDTDWPVSSRELLHICQMKNRDIFTETVNNLPIGSYQIGIVNFYLEGTAQDADQFGPYNFG